MGRCPHYRRFSHAAIFDIRLRLGTAPALFSLGRFASRAEAARRWGLLDLLLPTERDWLKAAGPLEESGGCGCSMASGRQ